MGWNGACHTLSIWLFMIQMHSEHLPSFHAVIIVGSALGGFMYNYLKPLQTTAQRTDNCSFYYGKIRSSKANMNRDVEASLKTWSKFFIKQRFAGKYIVYRELNMTFRPCEGQHKHTMVSWDTPFIYDNRPKSKFVSVIHTQTCIHTSLFRNYITR